MQPTNTQVEKTLEALQAGLPTDAGGRIPRDTLEIVLSELPDGLLDELRDGEAVRPERLAEAEARLQGGALPSDEDLAGRIVGRFVCDRLR